MKRDIYNELLEWKTSPRRKPLLLKGARQTGKTYILKEFGNKEYENLLYFNFDEDSKLEGFFSENLKPADIIENLSVYIGKKIRPVADLIFFDEIQVSNNALNSLKYFEEQAGDFHIVAAGSLLGVKLSAPKSFPVGKVNFLTLHPMTFLEFLDAVHKSEYRGLLEGLDAISPLSEPLHEELIKLLRRYYFVGGMPEAVRYYSEQNDVLEVKKIHKEIIDSYILDFAKHAPSSDIPKLTDLWNSVPSQLARENNKFMFSAVRKSARARDYENALLWLDHSGLILRSFLLSACKSPLSGYFDRSSFKVYLLDVGLLGAMANIPAAALSQGNALFNEFGGAFVENYVAGQLTSTFDENLYYWKNEAGIAEIDFVCEREQSVYPLEVKSGINVRSKSLKSFDDRFQPKFLCRTTLKNLKIDGKIINIPLYAISLHRRLLAQYF
ncbi:MAG: AAA family ATPase [Pseudomonadota bacterium]